MTNNDNNTGTNNGNGNGNGNTGDTNSYPSLNYNDNDSDNDDGPHPTVEEVIACQFSSWYPTFSNLRPPTSTSACAAAVSEGEPSSSSSPPLPLPYPRKNVTIKSIVISPGEIPQTNFRNFLLSDGVKLPICAEKLSSCATIDVVKRVEDLDDNDDDDSVGWTTEPTTAANHTTGNEKNNGEDKDDDSRNDHDDDDEEDEDTTDFEFPQLTKRIKEAIKTLGGAVMPKLNWSSPKDATWINEGTMKCQTPGDVYLLLKSSDFCLHDVLGQTIQRCRKSNYDGVTDNSNVVVGSSSHDHIIPPKLQIVLRKWRPNLHPSMEFRCFVRDHELIAISQRHHSQHYPHLMKDWNRLRERIDDFYEDVIYKRFGLTTRQLDDGIDDNERNDSNNDDSDETASRNTPISNFVFDVYVDQKDRVWIIDFNPWSSTTDALLYDWTELLTMDLCDDDGDDDGLPKMKIVETARQVRQDPLSSYRAPIDAIELASMTHGDSKEFEKFMKQWQQQTEDDR